MRKLIYQFMAVSFMALAIFGGSASAQSSEKNPGGPPVYLNTGNPVQDEANYNAAKTAWYETQQKGQVESTPEVQFANDAEKNSWIAAHQNEYNSMFGANTATITPIEVVEAQEVKIITKEHFSSLDETEQANILANPELYQIVDDQPNK